MLLNVVEIEKYYGTRNNLKKALDRVSNGHIYLGEQDLTTISSAKMARTADEAAGSG